MTEIFAAARDAGRHLLSEVEAKAALGAAGVPVTPTRLATSAAEAMAIAGELGYPVVLKVVSDVVTHKSDVGGVELDLSDAAAVEGAYARIEAAVTEAAGAEAFGGVSVQPMAAPGTEVIIGMTQDPQFGPVLMFGLGGVLVEVLKDVAFRVVPLEPHDAAEMIREIKAFPVLEGYRGAPPADLAALGVDPAVAVGVRGGAPAGAGARPEPNPGPPRRRDRGGRAHRADAGLTPDADRARSPGARAQSVRHRRGRRQAGLGLHVAELAQDVRGQAVLGAGRPAGGGGHRGAGSAQRRQPDGDPGAGRLRGLRGAAQHRADHRARLHRRRRGWGDPVHVGLRGDGRGGGRRAAGTDRRAGAGGRPGADRAQLHGPAQPAAGGALPSRPAARAERRRGLHLAEWDARDALQPRRCDARRRVQHADLVRQRHRAGGGRLPRLSGGRRRHAHHRHVHRGGARRAALRAFAAGGGGAQAGGRLEGRPDAGRLDGGAVAHGGPGDRSGRVGGDRAAGGCAQRGEPRRDGRRRARAATHEARPGPSRGADGDDRRAVGRAGRRLRAGGLGGAALRRLDLRPVGRVLQRDRRVVPEPARHGGHDHARPGRRSTGCST